MYNYVIDSDKEPYECAEKKVENNIIYASVKMYQKLKICSQFG